MRPVIAILKHTGREADRRMDSHDDAQSRFLLFVQMSQEMK